MPGGPDGTSFPLALFSARELRSQVALPGCEPLLDDRITMFAWGFNQAIAVAPERPA